MSTHFVILVAVVLMLKMTMPGISTRNIIFQERCADRVGQAHHGDLVSAHLPFDQSALSHLLPSLMTVSASANVVACIRVDNASILDITVRV